MLFRPNSIPIEKRMYTLAARKKEILGHESSQKIKHVIIKKNRFNAQWSGIKFSKNCQNRMNSARCSPDRASAWRNGTDRERTGSRQHVLDKAPALGAAPGPRRAWRGAHPTGTGCDFKALGRGWSLDAACRRSGEAR